MLFIFFPVVQRIRHVNIPPQQIPQPLQHPALARLLTQQAQHRRRHFGGRLAQLVQVGIPGGLQRPLAVHLPGKYRIHCGGFFRHPAVLPPQHGPQQPAAAPAKESPIGNGILRLIPQAQNGHICRSVQCLVFLAVPAAPQRVWEHFWERKKVRMIKKGFKGRCQKRQMKKCKEVVRTYGAIQLAYAERLEQEDSIIEFQCNVMLSGLEAGEYSSDFVCEKQNGDLMVRECVERRFLKKPMTVKLLDASRECWTRIKKLLMMLL